MATTVAREIAERVVRPVYGGSGLEDPGVGLFIGESCKFVLPATFVFGQGASQGRDHLLEELRKVIEAAVVEAQKNFNPMVRGTERGQTPPLDAVGPTVDQNNYYRGKVTR